MEQGHCVTRALQYRSLRPSAIGDADQSAMSAAWARTQIAAGFGNYPPGRGLSACDLPSRLDEIVIFTQSSRSQICQHFRDSPA
jgi:hypothetical protein